MDSINMLLFQVSSLLRGSCTYDTKTACTYLKWRLPFWVDSSVADYPYKEPILDAIGVNGFEIVTGECPLGASCRANRFDNDLHDGVDWLAG